MAQETFGDYRVESRAGDESGITAEGGEDISGGVETEVGNVSTFTLYLSVGAAVDVKVEASPDGGDTWYLLPESPVKFASKGDDAVHLQYNMNRIRLTGSNTSSVEAQIREVV